MMQLSKSIYRDPITGELSVGKNRGFKAGDRLVVLPPNQKRTQEKRLIWAYDFGIVWEYLYRELKDDIVTCEQYPLYSYSYNSEKKEHTETKIWGLVKVSFRLNSRDEITIKVVSSEYFKKKGKD